MSISMSAPTAPSAHPWLTEAGRRCSQRTYGDSGEATSARLATANPVTSNQKTALREASVASTVAAISQANPVPASCGPSVDASCSSRGGRRCPTFTAKGNSYRIKPKGGTVDCAGAASLWTTYLARAPSEGTGSSALVEIDGWRCAHYPPPDAPLVGSCETGDGSRLKVVSE
jgi:hypothetical protein